MSTTSSTNHTHTVPSNLTEWTRAIVNVDPDRVQQLYQEQPELLWTPLSLNDDNTEHAHLLAQLERLQVLGSELGDLSAIPYMLLDHLESTEQEDDETTLSVAQQKRSRLLTYLIQHATEIDLNTRSWGSCNNRTLHLAAFLGQPGVVKQLIQRGASMTISNDLGCTPKDIITTSSLTSTSTSTNKEKKSKPSSLPKLKKNYSSSERFQQLRAIATEQSTETSKRQGSQEDLRHQTKRQQDLSLLAKRSAVKNNPLFKKFEQNEQQQQQPPSRKMTSSSLSSYSNNSSTDMLSVPGGGGTTVDDNGTRRNSKVINSLMTKSYVSSSVFRQGEPERSPSRGSSPVPSSASSSRANSPAPPVSPSLPPSSPITTTPSNNSYNDQPSSSLSTDTTTTTSNTATIDHTSSTETTITTIETLPFTETPIVVNEEIVEEPPSSSSTPKEDESVTDETIPKTNDEKEGKDASINDTLSPEHNEQLETIEILNTQQRRLSEHLIQAEGDESRRWSGSQRSHWSVGVNSWDNVLNRENDNDKKEARKSAQSEADSEQWFDSNEEWYEENGVRYSLKLRPRSTIDRTNIQDSSAPPAIPERSPLRKSKLAMEMMMDDDSNEVIKHDRKEKESIRSLEQQVDDDDCTSDSNETMTLDNVQSHQQQQLEETVLRDEPATIDSPSADDASVVSRVPSASFSPQRVSLGAESVDTWPPPPTSPPRLNRNSGNGDMKEIDHYDLNEQNVVQHQQPPSSDDQQQRQQVTEIENSYNQYDQQEANHHDDDIIESPATAIAPVIYHSHHDEQQHQQQQQQRQSVIPINAADYGNISVGTTERYVSHRLHDQQQSNDNQYLGTNEYDEFLAGRPQSMKLELPSVDTRPEQSTSAFGKLYVRVSGADDLLLPLPKVTTYARCVVSDGQFEYMSRYEVLGQKVTFDYECIIDAQPDMIVNVSLHVRPDVHVRPKTGLSKWLTPARKQRETINGYVHIDDGSIGQSRFALGHMIQACNQKTYAANFDCFNSWYARSSKERQRQLRGEEDVLKVVGSLNVEMLYLPVSDPSLPIPRSLRECDLALRIRQWHQTCWHSGYISLRKEKSQIWERQYCRLIGSQLIAYSSKEAASSFEPLDQHDIADALRLVAASDQVIVTLVDVPDNRVFQSNTIVEQTARGFFRLTFPDTYVDCVGDDAQDSEEWVRVFKSMIGRVPLKMPITV
ncbi:hypothetical protein BDA99DRAFT_555470 [Phascolomyces articulosus]|uniref:PH domain-containing protein n=1 Tax=Phascolomyces articulosus TaxID=60185 RepID=A0AAD5KU08_9FUNG|nr:hypothetical protein BDA99DRAFT_555470 [Phascolomyces articulosus]